MGILSISLAARYGVAACSTTLGEGLEKIQTARGNNSAPIFALLSARNFWNFPRLAALSMLSILSVAWTVMANLMKLRRIRSRLPLDYSVTNFTNRLLLNLSPYEPPNFWDRSVDTEFSDILSRMKLVSRASHPGLIVGFLRILCIGMCTAPNFKLKSMIIRAVLDARRGYGTTTEKPSTP